jgi:hypothetical protein
MISGDIGQFGPIPCDECATFFTVWLEFQEISTTALYAKRSARFLVADGTDGGTPAQPNRSVRLLLFLILACAFLLRLHAARGTFFNPDECVHLLVANEPSLAAVYNASLTEAHPPLLFFVLHLWKNFGTSEWFLRLPSVFAGTLFCWALFLWVRRLLGPSVAWAALLLAAFLPPMIELSAEVRQYALLLCFVTFALYSLESALAGNSAVRMLLAIGCLYLALLTHFSAFLFAGVFGIYSALRLVRNRTSPAALAIWFAGMAGTAGLFLFFYRTHISHLHGSAVDGRMQQLLSRSYFHWSHDHLLLFAFARTFGVCQWVFGQLAVGDLAGLALLAGLWCLFRAHSEDEKPPLRLAGVLLLLPFFINCIAAIAGLYPYGGTRHSAFLAPFVLAGVSFALVRFTHARMSIWLPIAALTIAACHLFGAPHRPYMRRQDQQLSNMTQAMQSLRIQAAPGDAIFVDYQTYFMIRYYLCPEVAATPPREVDDFRSFACGNYRVISTSPALNIFSADSFIPSWQQMARSFHLRSDQPVWVFQSGWDISLAMQLQSRPEFRGLSPESFGKNITLFKLPVSQ